MENTPSSAPAEEPVAPPVAVVPVVPAEDPKVGPCVACKEHVRVESLSYRALPDGGYTTDAIVCALCRGTEAMAQEIKNTCESIPRLLKTQVFMVGELMPALRKAGIFPKLVTAQWAGYVTVRPFDREQGMKLAGALGHLVTPKHSWKKEQEYQEAFFKLSGRLERDGISIDLVISGVAPSEACVITYEEVDVPARKEKRAKIVCKEPAPPVVVP